MKSITTLLFWKLYNELPEDVKSRADSAYELWQINPHAHGLYFKRVGKKRPVYSVRIGSGYRALGVLQGDAVIWFWIGTHDEYEGILKHL